MILIRIMCCKLRNCWERKFICQQEICFGFFFVLERSFGISFDEEDVENGKFDTFVHIEELLIKELNILVDL